MAIGHLLAEDALLVQLLLDAHDVRAEALAS
jgi:hypothetical protein